MSITPRLKRDHTCIEPDCSGPMAIKGLCRKHYTARYKATSDRGPGGNVPRLSAEQCAEVRRMSSQFKTQREIALHFGVQAALIRKVLRREYVPRD